MIRLAEYLSKQDKLIDNFIKKVLKDRKNLQKYIKELFIDTTLLGVASANTEIEKLSKKHFSERGIRPLRITLSDVKAGKGIIDKASNFWDEYSFKLAGKFEKDRLEEASKVFQRLTKEGYTQRELQKELGRVLEIKDAKRLKDIGITETTKCFNHGRIETARDNAKNGGIVRGVKFTAVMDGHQSQICDARHGLVLAIDDPRIDENTPPLHVRCRSILVFIDKWDWEEMYGSESSSEWKEIMENPKTMIGKTWGNAFAYGKEKGAANIAFKTKKEAVEYFKKSNININFKKNDLEIVRELGKIKEDLDIKFPSKIEIGTDFFDKFDPDGTAIASYFDDAIYINNKYGIKDWEELAKEMGKIYEWSTSDKRHVILHELGHYTHSRVNKELYIKLLNYKPSAEEFEIMQSVSYGSTDPREFVAEVYCKLFTRRYNIPIKAMDLFHKFGGEMI